MAYSGCTTKQKVCLESPESGLSNGPTYANFGCVVGWMQGFESGGIGFGDLRRVFVHTALRPFGGVCWGDVLIGGLGWEGWCGAGGTCPNQQERTNGSELAEITTDCSRIR